MESTTIQSSRRHFRICAAFALAMLMAARTYAADTNSAAAATSDGSNADEMIALMKEVDAAERAYMHPVGISDYEKRWSTYSRLNQTNLPRIFDLARHEPQTEISFEMFKWIVMNRQITVPSLYTNAVQSLVYLREYDAANSGVIPICRTLGNNWYDPFCQPAVDFLQAVGHANPDREARGQAVLALARLKQQGAQYLALFQEAPPASARFERLRTNSLAMQKNETPAGLSREAEELYREVLEQYANCPSQAAVPVNTRQEEETLGDIAKTDLFELEHLSVGDLAPDIEGRGIDGTKLELSQYRGKIVLLSFWESRCGPCMQMVPSEVRLAERMEGLGKPVALIGVNGDERRDDAQKAVEQNNMFWPSFYSDKGPNGPIPTAWNVRGWPTVFILDGKGVIRFKFSGYGPDTENFLDGKVDQLLKESE